MAKEIFGFRLSKKELNQIIKPKKLFIGSVGALIVAFLILPLIKLPWEGWNVVLSTIGGMILSEYLD